MNFIKKILVLVWKCWFNLLNGVLVIIIGVFFVYPLSFSDRTFPYAYKGIRLWALLTFYGSGFRLKVERKVKLDKKQAYIFIANHSSILDIMVMAIIHKHHPIVFVGKKELAEIPIFGTIYKRICIVVNRQDIKSRTHVFSLAKERINKGESIVIFPEGGVPDDRNILLDSFRDGAFTIGISTHAPIAVYTIKGLKEMFPESFWIGYPGRVKLKLIKIIQTKDLTLDDKNEIKDSCYQMMYAELKK